jgi:hypothetical protein
LVELHPFLQQQLLVVLLVLVQPHLTDKATLLHSGQTVFTVTGGYTVGYLQVYLNGVLLNRFRLYCIQTAQVLH